MKNVFQSIFRSDATKTIELPQADKPLLRPLEPRVLLDAAAAETSFDLAERSVLEQQAADYVANDDSNDVADTVADALDADAIAPPLERDRRNEIVFVDGGIENLGQIIGSLNESAEIVILDQDSDGVEQIAEALEGREGIDAIHIISHGSVGSLTLGSGELTVDSMLGEHADEMAAIRDALDVNGDILIYGCEFGQGEEGLAAAEALSRATSADVAASDDLTGAESSGGDWDLEVHAGEVDTAVIEAYTYDGVLLDTDGDGVDDDDDVDDDNDGILDINEGKPASVTAPDGTSSAHTWEDNGTHIFSNGEAITDGTAHEKSGFAKHVAEIYGSALTPLDATATATPNVYDIPGATLTFTGSAATDRTSITTSNNQIASDSGTGIKASFSTATNSLHHEFSFDLDETSNYFGFNLIDINDTRDNANHIFSIYADGVKVAEINGNSVGANGTGNNVLMKADGTFIGNLSVGHNRENFIGITSLDGFDNITIIAEKTNYTATDRYGIDQFFMGKMVGLDSDDDGVFDHLDLDSDNDGITDNVEAQTTQDYIKPLFDTDGNPIDADKDGLNDAYDKDTSNVSPTASEGLSLVDTDGDLTVDYLDSDSDNDGKDDITERGTGPTSITSNTDTDGDGLLDIFEGANSNDGYNVNDENMNPADSEFLLADSDNDLDADGKNADPLDIDLDFREALDTDGDNIRDSIDIDDDNDGILDEIENRYDVKVVSLEGADGSFESLSGVASSGLFNSNVTGGGWYNGAGTADSWIDVGTGGAGKYTGLADGTPNSPAGGVWAGARPDETFYTDLTDLVVGETYTLKFWQVNAGTDTLPLNSQMRWKIQFGDEVKYTPYMAYLREGNQVWQEATVTFTATQTNQRLEFIGDKPLTASGEPYNPGSTNYLISNMGVDGIELTRTSVTPINTDGDSASSSSVDLDSDNDGIGDAYESGFVVAEQTRLGDIIESDTATQAEKDNAADMLSKMTEIFADGTITEAESSEYLTLKNGVATHGDADGDGLMDIFDQDISDTTPDASIGAVPVDSDGDGIKDFLDLDSDGDGISDTIEARPTVDFATTDDDVTNDDSDGDGIIDIFDTNVTFGGTHTNLSNPVDTDGDGIADYLDTDSDNDAILDKDESGLTYSDPDVVDSDVNNDGIDDAIGASYANPDGDVSATNSPSQELSNTIGDIDANSEVDYREVRQPPTIYYPPNSATSPLGSTEDQVFKFDASTGTNDPDNRIIISDADAAGGTETYTVTLSDPAHGTFAAIAAGSATVTLDATTGLVTITGSLDDVNSTLETLTYTGDADYYHTGTTSDSFTLTVSDGKNEAGVDDASADVTTEMFIALAAETDINADTVTVKQGAEDVTFNVLDGGAATATVATDIVSSSIAADNFEAGATGTNLNSDTDKITKINGDTVSGTSTIIYLDSNGDTVELTSPTGVAATDDAAALAAGAVAKIDVNADTGAIVFNKISDTFTGSVEFDYSANTALGTEEASTATVVVNSRPTINSSDAPVETHEDSEHSTAPADGKYPISGLSVADADGNVAMTVELTSPAHGDIEVDLTAGGTLATGDVTNTGTNGNITLVGNRDDINAVLATLTVEPNTVDFHTDTTLDEITITVTDSSGDVATDTIEIEINSVEDATDDTISTYQGDPVTFNVLTGEHDLAIADDFEGDPATVTSVNGVTVPTDGTTVSIPVAANGEPVTATNPAVGTVVVGQDGEMVFTPADDDYIGIVNLTYVAQTADGTPEEADITLFVKKSNEPVPPSLTPGNPVDMVEDGGAYTISGVQLIDPYGVDTPMEVTLSSPEHGDIAVDEDIIGAGTDAPDVVVETDATTGDITITGPLDQVNLVLATLNVTPDADFHTGNYDNGTDIPVEEIVVTAKNVTDAENPIEAAPITVRVDVTAEQDANDDVVKYVPGADSSFNILTGTGTAYETADDFEGTTTTVTHINGVELTAGTPITIFEEDGALMGTITVATNGYVTFSPATDYEGAGKFSYTATTADGIAESADVYLSNEDVTPPVGPEITNPYDPAADGSALNINEDLVDANGDPITAVSIPGIIIEDVDNDGSGIITVTLTQPQNGVIAVDLTDTNVTNLADGFGSVQNLVLEGTLEEINTVLGTLTFDPDADFHTGEELGGGDIGMQQVVISVQDADGLQADPSTINIDIAPVVDINADAGVETTQNNSVDFNVVTGSGGATADEFEGGDVTILAINGVGPQPIAGGDKVEIPVTANGEPVTGTNFAVGTVTSDRSGNMTFTPSDASYKGPAVFTYIAKTADGIAEETTVTVSVNEGGTPGITLPDAPIVTHEDLEDGSAPADGKYPIAGVQVTDSDGNLPMTVELTSPAHGDIEVDLTAGGTLADGAVTNTGTDGNILLVGNRDDINAVLATLTVTPNTVDYHTGAVEGSTTPNAMDTITVTVTDETSNTSTGDIQIQINSVEDATDDTLSTYQGEPVTFNVLTGEYDLAIADDFEGDPATVTAVNGTAVPTDGSTVSIPVAANGEPVTATNPAVGTVVVGEDGEMVFTPTDPDYVGTVNLNYTAETPTGTQEVADVTIFVKKSNEPVPPSLTPGNPVDMVEDGGAYTISGVQLIDPYGVDTPMEVTLSSPEHGDIAVDEDIIGAGTDAPDVVVETDATTGDITITGPLDQVNLVLATLNVTPDADFHTGNYDNGTDIPVEEIVVTAKNVTDAENPIEAAPITVRVDVTAEQDANDDVVKYVPGADSSFNILTGTGTAYETADDFEGTTTTVTHINGVELTAGTPITIFEEDGALMGTITVATNGYVTFSPATDYEGAGKFSYTATTADGIAESADVYLSNEDVTPPVGPEITNPYDPAADGSALNINEDLVGLAAADGDTTTGVKIPGVVITDADNDPTQNITVTLTQPQNGVISVDLTAGTDVANLSDGFGSVQNLVLEGTLEEINKVLATLTYLPDADFHTGEELGGGDIGMQQVVISVQDADGLQADPSTINIDIAPVVDINADGDPTPIDIIQLQTVSFNPVTDGVDEPGTADTFENDDVTILAINGVGPQPIAGGDKTVIDVTADGGPVTADNPVVGTVTSDRAGNMEFTATNINSTGPAVFSYIAKSADGIAEETTVTFNIILRALGPDANNDSVEVTENESTGGNAISNDTDPNDDVLTVTKVNGVEANVSPEGGEAVDVAGDTGGTFTVAPDGTWTFDPGTDFDSLQVGETAVSKISYEISDGNGGTATAEIIVKLNGENDAPSVIDPETGEPGVPGKPGAPGTNDSDDLLGNKDGVDGIGIESFSVAANFTDIDDPDNTIKYSAANLPQGLSISDAGVISGIPAANASQYEDPNVENPVKGVYNVVITAVDRHGATVTDSFTYRIENQDPDAKDDTATFTEDTLLQGNVITGVGTTSGDAGEDVDEDALTVTQFVVDGTTVAVTGDGATGTHTIDGVGTVTLFENGNFTFDPVDNFNGNGPTIEYTIVDNEGGTDTATLTIGDGIDVNDAPVANLDRDQYIEDTTATGNVITGADTTSGESGRDTDIDGDTLTVTKFTVGDTTISVPTDGSDATHTIPGVGTFTMNNTGQYTFDPADNYDGPVPEIGYTITDGTDTASSSLQISSAGGVNDIPVANEDTLTIDENATDAGGNVVTNDTDDDGDTLTVTKVNDVAANVGTGVAGDNGGTFTVNENGTWTFDPGTEFDYLGLDETAVTKITYEISDGNGGFDTAEVIVTIEGSNDAPVIVPATDPDKLGDQSGMDGQDIDAINTADNFTDVDDADESLTFTADNLPKGLEIDPDTGVITGIIDASASQGGDNPTTAPGVYEVTITATDPHDASVSDTFIYTVGNPGPDAVDDTATFTEDTLLEGNVITGAGTTSGDAGKDVDEDALTVTQFVVDGTTVSVPQDGTTGTHTIDGVGTVTFDQDGNFTFDPADDFNGNGPTIDYTISDGEGGTDTATLTIGDGVDVNDKPEARNDVDLFTEDQVSTGNVLTGVDTLSLDNGIDTDIDGDDLSVTQFVVDGTTVTVPDGGTGTHTVAGVGTFVVGSDGEYTFTPVTNYVGNVPSVTYTISDGVLTDEAILSFQDTVLVNDPPVATDDEETGDENATDIGGNALSNDTDPEDDNLTITEINGETAGVGAEVAGDNGGTFTVASDGTWTFDPGADFDYLNEGQTKTTEITYTVDDGNGGEHEATITVIIEGSNDAPSVIVPVDPTDPTGPTEPGVPGEPGTPGTDDPDDLLGNRTGVDGDTLLDPIDVTANFTDIDDPDETIKYSAVNLPRGLTISESGLITGTFLPDASAGGDNNDGVYTVTIVATDRHNDSVTDTFTYTVDNPPPVAADDTAEVTEDTVATGNVTDGDGTTSGDAGVDKDPDGDVITVTQFVVDGTTVTIPEDGTGTHTISGVGTIVMGSDGTFTFTPVENYDGLVPDVVYTLTDIQGKFDTATLSMGDIVDVNDTPEAIDDSVTVQEGSTATVNLIDNDLDIDGDDLTVDSVIIDGVIITPGVPTTIAGGVITVEEDGSASFVPDEGFSGIINGTYVATDGEDTDRASFVITVTDVPDPVDPGTPPEPVDPADPIVPFDPSFDPVPKGIITQTVQEIQDLNRTQEGIFSSTPSTTFTQTAVFNLGSPDGLLGDYIAIDLGEFDGDTLIAEGLITEDNIETANNDENVLKLFVNTYVRQSTLFIDIANNQSNLDKDVVKTYKIASLDGKPLPDWIRMARNGFVIAEPPADVRAVDIMITAELEDGSTIDRVVSIESETGVINMAQVEVEPESGAPESAEGFSEKVKSELDAKDKSNDLL